jgi:hypothetical protein
MQSADLECFFFFWRLFFFFFVFSRPFKFMMTGLMVPIDSPWFILWSPLMKIPRICHGSLWDCVCGGFEFYMTLLRCHQFRWHWFRHDFVHDRTWCCSDFAGFWYVATNSIWVIKPLPWERRLHMGLLRCHQYDNSFFFPFFSVFQGNNDGADGLLVCDRTCCNGPTKKKMARAHLVHSST